MKRFLLIVALMALACGARAERILFIGNSYTGVNNLPAIFREVVHSGGHGEPVVEAVTPGGKTFEQQSSFPPTLAKIDAGNWDVVILQGQSQEAAMAEAAANIRASLLKGAAALCERIQAKNPNARIVLYETWARHADYWKDAKAAKAVGPDPTTMQARTRKWYQRIAADHKGVVVAPVGDAWELNYKNPQAHRLHATDNSHPTYAGSYLAALVIYATIYHPAKLDVVWHGKLSDAEAAYLQHLAQTIPQPQPSR